MAGFQANTGLTGSVVGSLYGPAGAGNGTAASPPRTFIPEGPATLSAAAYGDAGASGGFAFSAGGKALWGGIIALGLLVGIWCTLPR